MKKLGKSLLLVLVAMIWGVAFVAQSSGMDYVGPFTYNCVRMLLGGIVLIPVIMIMDKKKSNEEILKIKANKKIQFIGGICCGIALFTGSILQQFGVKYTTVGKASFITAMYIVLVPILSIFLKKHVSKIASVSVLAAVVGFYMLCLSENTSLAKGDGLVLICTFAFSVHIIVIDYFSGLVDCIRMSSMQFIVGGLLSGIGMFIFENPSLSSIWDCRIEIGYAGIMSCGVAYTLQIVAQKDVNPTVASLLMSLESIFGAVAGYIILDEIFTRRQLLGCIIIFVAVILAQMPDNIFRKTK